jgi:hypothetical protein
MAEVIVGVVLTALLGGLLVPFVKGRIDRRSERFRAAAAQVDTLADALWAYWKLAFRIAFYGKDGRSKDLEAALENWDSEKSWQMGSEIEIQFSRSKRLFPSSVHDELDRTQTEFMEYLDKEIDRLRDATPGEWEVFFTSLRNERRTDIDSLLTKVMRSLKIGRTPTDRNPLARLNRLIRGRHQGADANGPGGHAVAVIPDERQ